MTIIIGKVLYFEYQEEKLGYLNWKYYYNFIELVGYIERCWVLVYPEK
jgi:hypothetical protein